MPYFGFVNPFKRNSINILSRKKIIFSIYFLLTSITIFCQTWQTSLLSNNSSNHRFDDVYFMDNNIGWAANGYNAAVYKTNNGGVTWTELINENDLGGNYYFRNIEFLDYNNGFLGTLNGEFFKTIDGGLTWTEVTNINPNPVAICGLDTVGDFTVYGCGAYFEPAFIIKSIDGGNTWEYIDMSPYATALVEVLFISDSIGYVSGKNNNGGCILKTVDGGNSWFEIYNSNISGQYVWKLQIFTDPHLIIGSLYSTGANPGKIIKSYNDGANWTIYNAPETNIQAVGFIDENTGWMGGHNTGFYETNNGGQTWTDLNIGSNLNRIFIINSNLAFASGTSIYKFTNETLNINETNLGEQKSLDIILKNNPVSNNLEFKVYFEKTDNLLIELYSIDGKFIKQLSREIISEPDVIKNYSFNVDNLSSGSYIIDFHNNNQRKNIIFLKE